MVLGKRECPGTQTIPSFSYPESPTLGFSLSWVEDTPYSNSPEDTPYSHLALGRHQSMCKQGAAEARTRAGLLTGAAQGWMANVSGDHSTLTDLKIMPTQEGKK